MLVPKPRNRKWRLILRTCCPPPAAALRAAYARCARVFSLFFCLFHSVILPKKCRFTKLPTLFTHSAQKTTPTNQLFPGPSARSAGPANQPPGPARVLPGSPTGQKFLRSAYSTRRTSKWVKMGYFTPLQAPRSIFSPLSILKLRHEGHSGLLDALGCQGKEPLRPLRRGRPLRECAKCGTNQPTSGGLECAEWGTTQPTQGPEWVNRVGSLVKPSGAAPRSGVPWK